MRAIFVLLLIANLMFFGWIMSDQSDADGRPQIIATPGVETITLLNEVATAGASAREPDSQPDSAAPVATQPPDAGRVADAAQQEVKQDGITDTPAAASKVKEEQQAGAAVKQPRPALEQQPEADTAVAANMPVSPKKVDSCHTVGPFRDMGKLRGIIKAVKNDVLEASFRSREETEQTLFWVYLKPESDLASAKATTRMLRKKRIKDSYIIGEGDKQFGISLGHFKEKLRAYTLRDRIAKLGFKPVVDPVFRTYTIFWLDYRLAAGKDNASMLEGLKLGSTVNQFERACN